MKVRGDAHRSLLARYALGLLIVADHMGDGEIAHLIQEMDRISGAAERDRSGSGRSAALSRAA